MSSDLHIAVFPSWYPDRDNPIRGSFFREQCQALSRYGIRVAVFTMPKVVKFKPSCRRLFRNRYSREDDDCFPVFRSIVSSLLPDRCMKDRHAWQKRALRKQIQAYTRQHGSFDLIHAHSALPGGVLARHFSKELSVPYVVTEHFSGYLRGSVQGIKYEQSAIVFADAGRLICVSSALRSRIIKDWDPEYPERIVEIPNPLPKAFEHAPVFRTSPKVTALTVGFLQAKKGHCFLLHAIAELAAEDKLPEDVEFRIVGDGPEYNRLVQLTRKLNIANHVTFLGRLSREAVAAEMNNCTFFCLPSLFETFGIVLIEALSCGKPLIATRCGGPESIVTDANGVLVKPGKSRVLARAIENMLHSYSSYDPQQLHDDCILRYGEENVISNIIAVYSEVVAEFRQKEHHT